MNGQLGRACTKYMPHRRRVRRISRPRVNGVRHRVLLDRNLQSHRKDRPSHLEEAGGRTEEVDLRLDSVGAVDPMPAEGDLRLDSVEEVVRRPESAEAVDLRVAVGAGRMAEAVVVAGATAAVMAGAD